MARLASHKIVLHMKLRTEESLQDGTRETVEHMVVTDRRRILWRTNIIVRTSKGTKRTYGRWTHWSRLSNKTSVKEYQSQRTMEGWITVPIEPEVTNASNP